MTALEMIQKLKELRALATPGPWHDDGYRIYGPTEAQDKREGPILTDYKQHHGTAHDGFFICEAANSLPQLCEMLTVALEALEHMKQRDAACSPCNGRCDWDVRDHDTEVSRKAISKINLIAGAK